MKGRLNPFEEPEAPSTSYDYDGPLHQLWPPADHIFSTDFDVVFFPGLQQPGDWSQNWLPQDLGGNVRVLALRYDVSNDISEIATNLLQSLVLRFIPHYVHTGFNRVEALSHVSDRGLIYPIKPQASWP
jgi:hypothetical protein